MRKMKTEKQEPLTNKSHSQAETLEDLPVDEAGPDEVKGGSLRTTNNGALINVDGSNTW